MPRPLNQTDTDLNADNLLRLPAEFGCPVWVYDAQIVREEDAALHQFDVVRFAQKACSNIHILRLMRENSVKVDSVSLGEIERALAAGFDPKTDPDAIVFTARSDRRRDACPRCMNCRSRLMPGLWICWNSLDRFLPATASGYV